MKIEPKDGEVVGSFGGSGMIDSNNQITFENVPPETYVLNGTPPPVSN